MEGAIYAVTATISTMIVVGILYYLFVVPAMKAELVATGSNQLFTPVFFLLLAALQLGLSLVVGVSSSYWATKKHLST